MTGPAGRAGASVPAPVLFVHSGRDWIRGSERCLLDLIARVDRARFAPVLACDSAVLAREAAALGAVTEVVPTWRAGWRPPVAQLRLAWHLVRAHGVRLIHANNLIPLPSLLPAARARGIPVVTHVHLMITPTERLHSWLHQASVVVGVSRHVVAGLLDDGMPADRVRVVYNGVDRERLSRGDARGLRSALGIAPETLVVTVTGSLIAIKGQRVILDALARLRGAGVDAHVLFIGRATRAPWRRRWHGWRAIPGRGSTGVRGSEQVGSAFTAERFIGEFEALYGELLATGRRAHGWRSARWSTVYRRWIGGAVRRRMGGRRRDDAGRRRNARARYAGHGSSSALWTGGEPQRSPARRGGTVLVTGSSPPPRRARGAAVRPPTG